MKRFHKALLTAAACAALLISAQAAEPQDVLQTVLPAVQQEWQSTGTVSTTYFSGDDYLMQLSSLVPEKHLYTVTLLMEDTSGASIYKCGVFDPQTGKLVVPLEYDSIEATPDGELVLCQWGTDSPRYWFADAAGALTQIDLPTGYTDLLPDRSGLFIISKRVQKPAKDLKMLETTTANVEQFAIADRNMNIIRDNIDGGASGPSIWPPEYTNGVFIIQTGGTQWETGMAYRGCNGTFGLIDKTGNWIGRHDYQSLSWADQHFVARRNGKYYLLDGKGGETPVTVPMEMYRYSSWAKKEADAAQTHDIETRFAYPQLDITRAKFTELTMQLYRTISPDREVPQSDKQFSDCEDAEMESNVQNAVALGIVNGYEDGTFRPYRTISREEAAAMLNRLYTALGGTADTVSGETYADDAQIDDWARDSVYAMREKNIMTGKQDNKFCPKDGYTAEQAVVTMERMYQAER